MRAEFRQRDDVTQTRNACYLCLKEIVLGDPERETSQRIWSSTHVEGNCKTQTGKPTTGAQGVVVRESEGAGETESWPVMSPEANRASTEGTNWCGPSALLPLGCWWENLKKKKGLRPNDRSSSGPKPECFQPVCSRCRWERMYYRSALFPPSPQVADTPKSVSGVSERHSAMCCRLMKPGRHPLRPPLIPLPSLGSSSNFPPERQRWTSRTVSGGDFFQSKPPQWAVSPHFIFLKEPRPLLENNKMQCVWFTFLISLRNR